MLPCFLKYSVSETNILIFLSEIGKHNECLTLSYISNIYPLELSAKIPVGVYCQKVHQLSCLRSTPAQISLTRGRRRQRNILKHSPKHEKGGKDKLSE